MITYKKQIINHLILKAKNKMSDELLNKWENMKVADLKLELLKW
jgi:hypothetical protein